MSTVKADYLQLAIMELAHLDNADFKLICHHMASKEPEMFVRYLHTLEIASQMSSVTADIQIKQKYDQAGFVPAIKLCRELFGYGLKEAKEYVEDLCQHVSSFPHQV